MNSSVRAAEGRVIFGSVDNWADVRAWTDASPVLDFLTSAFTDLGQQISEENQSNLDIVNSLCQVQVRVSDLGAITIGVLMSLGKVYSIILELCNGLDTTMIVELAELEEVLCELIEAQLDFYDLVPDTTQAEMLYLWFLFTRMFGYMSERVAVIFNALIVDYSVLPIGMKIPAAGIYILSRNWPDNIQIIGDCQFGDDMLEDLVEHSQGDVMKFLSGHIPPDMLECLSGYEEPTI